MHKVITRGFYFYSIFFLLSLPSTTLLANDAQQEAEIFHGERLFLETRFAYYFYQAINSGDNVNTKLEQGDPKLDKTYRFFGLPPYQIPFATSPFKGTSFSCRTCHMVDEHVEQKELGMRGYNDFTSRSPLTERSDNKTITLRNSPILVGLNTNQDHAFFHYDGEFSSIEDLIIGTLTGRNLGWLITEKELAKQHICKVLKNDDGKNGLAIEFGGFSYKEVFAGKKHDGSTLETDYLISTDKVLNISEATCDDIIQLAVKLIASYMSDLKFASDSENYSPYDLFLIANNLPLTPAPEETDQDYGKHLLAGIKDLKRKNKLKFIQKNPATKNSTFKFHDQPFKFEEIELKGLEIFFSKTATKEFGSGNCVSCHTPPHFTDFGLHNIGVTQIEYEAMHGPGSFFDLFIPTKKERDEKADFYLPATHMHPNRLGLFRRAASQDNINATDLGVWNILLNDDYPKPQNKLYKSICSNNVDCSTPDKVLNHSVARFKTPSLRNLGHSAPYMHNGQISDLHAVISFYLSTSFNNRSGKIRNPDPELAKININPKDIEPLVRFLISLYEDYH